MRRMTPLLCRFLTATALVFAYLLLQGLLDYRDRTFAANAAYRKWVSEVCLPISRDEKAVARIEDGRLHCEIIENAGYGRAPAIASAATMEIPE
jgi:hypothetical protein